MELHGNHVETLRFVPTWHEDVILRDGTQVALRLIRPDDKAALARAFDRLSPDSRYRRFLSAKNRLTDEELRYLTEVDGWTHLCIVAIDLATGEGIASARFIRYSAEPDVAEAVVTVADDWTEKGLGRLLLDRLVAAAAERGIRAFRVEVLARDKHMLRLVHELAPGVPCRPRDGVVCIEVALPEAATDPARGARRLLRLVAQGTVDHARSAEDAGVRPTDA